MGLSLKTRILDDLQNQVPRAIDLHHSSSAFNLDEWPLLQFLKGMGIQSVEFFTKDPQAIERWSERILGYELIFLEDPDSLKMIECQWNELDPLNNQILIQCKIASAGVFEDRSHLTDTYSVPPMHAPLGISEEARLKIIDEVAHQSPQDVLSRFVSILQEYRTGAKKIDPVVWAFLVGDIVTVALDSKLLEKAIQLIDEHKLALAPLWSNTERVQRLFAAYDPKPSELVPWARIFDSLSTAQLMTYVEALLGTPAGPQILKLMNMRAQQDPAELVDICFRSQALTQKLLLQWLAPHWRPFHYGRILNALDTLLQSPVDPELLRLWLQALIRASKTNAFDDLVKVFKPRFFGLWGARTSLQTKRALLNALAEQPSSDSIEFLKKIRAFVHGELADQVEKLLHGYREVKS